MLSYGKISQDFYGFYLNILEYTSKIGLIMGKNVKAKGNNGERKVADFLTNLYGQKFTRVPNSGAFIGGSNSFRRIGMDAGQIAIFKADLIPPSNMRKLVIESKFYKDFSFHNLIKNNDLPMLDKWISQAKDSIDAGDLWFVVFRINHKGTFAVFDQEHLQKFKLDNYCIYKTNIVTEFETFFSNNKDQIFNMVQTSEA